MRAIVEVEVRNEFERPPTQHLCERIWYKCERCRRKECPCRRCAHNRQFWLTSWDDLPCTCPTSSPSARSAHDIINVPDSDGNEDHEDPEEEAMDDDEEVSFTSSGPDADPAPPPEAEDSEDSLSEPINETVVVPIHTKDDWTGGDDDDDKDKDDDKDYDDAEFID